MKVLIVGAGPTGLTAGLEFARQGIIPDIADAKTAPSPLSRAVGILPRSIEILGKTGVGQKILEEGTRIYLARIYRGNTALIDLDMQKLLGEGNFLIGLPQDRTEALMQERLQEMGVAVQYETKVTNIETSTAGASATFEDGTTHHYDWIIGADGVNSTTRTSLGIQYTGYELPEDWSIADVELGSGYDPHTIQAWLREGKRAQRDAVVMVPIAHNRVRLISSTPDSMGALPIALDVKKVRRSGMFKISVRQAEKYVCGTVLLAGDAAHAHSPIGGRGMNLGIEDAEAAVHAILHNDTKAYERKRKKKAGAIIAQTESARKMLVSNSVSASLFLRSAAWIVRHSHFFQNKFARRILKL